MFVADSKRLTHAGAKKIADTAVAKARQAGIAISVAVADAVKERLAQLTPNLPRARDTRMDE